MGGWLILTQKGLSPLKKRRASLDALMGKTLLLRSETRRSLILVSALLLAGLGLYFISLAGWNLAGKHLSETANQLYFSTPLSF